METHYFLLVLEEVDATVLVSNLISNWGAVAVVGLTTPSSLVSMM